MGKMIPMVVAVLGACGPAYVSEQGQLQFDGAGMRDPGDGSRPNLVLAGGLVCTGVSEAMACFDDALEGATRVEDACFLVGDRTRGEDPWFALTGDTLFVGSVGRPDLHGADESRRMAGQLYDSLQRLMAVDDVVEVYPGHFAGSACGRAMSAKPSSTIGFERRFNEALRPRTRAEFVDFVTGDLPPQPPDFARIRRTNQGLTAEATAPPLV